MPLDLATKNDLTTAAPAAIQRIGTKLKPSWSTLTPIRRWLYAGAGAAILLAAGVGVTTLSGQRQDIVTAPVTRGNLERAVLATGVLEPSRLLSVGAQVSGQVRRLHVVLGQEVKAGDLIAEIDSTTQQNNVSAAQAGVANLQAQRSASAATLAQAEATFTRQQKLLAADAISRADFEAAESALAGARANLTSIDAQIRQAQLQLSTSQVNLGYTRIVAPMDGTIVAIVTEEGQTVNANQSAPTIVKLAQLDTMTVNAEISEADVASVAAGAVVYFTTLGDANHRHYAQLRTIAPAPASIKTSDDISSTDTAVYYDGLFDIENADGALRTGMTAQVSIVLESAENALLIPASALGPSEGDGIYRVPVSASGRVDLRRVKIGVNNNVSAQVIDGLAEGDHVVVAQRSVSAATKAPNAGGGIIMGGSGRPPGGGRP